jgi:aryl-alcohol dehydrogenase-like predicted oxidoreductase
LDVYVGNGGNFIDTAEGYSAWAPGNVGGESESIIGSWLKLRECRNQVVLVSKGGAPKGDGPSLGALRPKAIRQALEHSLRRLRTDYLDVYLAHFDDSETPLEETLATYHELVRDGLIRAYGFSNYSAERIRAAITTCDTLGLNRPVCVQPRYNLVERSYETDIEPLAIESQLGVFTYSALAEGFLTGKYRLGGPMPDTPRAERIRAKYLNESGGRALERLQSLAHELHATDAQVAIAWVLGRPSIAAAITSARSVEQAIELMGAEGVVLAPDQLKYLAG